MTDQRLNAISDGVGGVYIYKLEDNGSVTIWYCVEGTQTQIGYGLR